MKLPWRKVRMWKCYACGKCCIAYTPKLTYYEYLKMPEQFVMDKRGRYYIRKFGRRCPFQNRNLCMIQYSKPLSCRLFPFSVHRRGDERALIEYGGEEYYVYVDPFCPNITLGNPTKSLMEKVIQAVKLVSGKEGDFSRLTCNIDFKNQFKLQSSNNYFLKAKR